MKIKREDIDNMSHISVIAAIALPENLEEAARSIPDEVIKQGMVMEHCLYYSQVQNQHLDLENIVITDQHRYEGLAEALSDQIMAPYSMIPNEQTPKEFEDETEAAIREYETKRDDFVRLLNGRIVPIYDYGFSKDYVVKDGLICKRRFGPLQREKRTKKAKKMQLLLDCPFKKVYPAFVDYVLQYVGNEFLNWRSGYFYNPQGYWNSFVVGGRYRNQFLVPVDCPFAVTGSYGVFEYQHDEQTYTPEGYRWVAGAKKRNIAWDALKKYREKVPVEQFHQYGAWCAQGGGPAECRLVQMDEGPIKKWGRGCFQGCETLEQFGSDKLPAAASFDLTERRFLQLKGRHNEPVFELRLNRLCARYQEVSNTEPHAVIGKDRKKRLRIEVIIFPQNIQGIFTNGFFFYLHRHPPFP